jgi:hypothetical protein
MTPQHTGVFAGALWRKSSYSADNGNCVELAWRKSTYSADNGNCVELSLTSGFAGLRDSKNPEGPALVLPVAHLAAFVSTTKLTA